MPHHVSCLRDPQHGAVAVGIQCRDPSMLLPRDQNLAPVRQRVQDGRPRHVVVAIFLVRYRGVESMKIAGSQLCRPAPLAGVEVEGDDGVAGPRVRYIDIAIARTDVEGAAPVVESGRRPDPGTRWAVQLCAGGVLPNRPGTFRDRVGLPDLLAGRSIQGHHTALERAALVRGGSCGRPPPTSLPAHTGVPPGYRAQANP